MLLRWPSVLRGLEDIPYHPLRSAKQPLTATNTLVTANTTTLTNSTQGKHNTPTLNQRSLNAGNAKVIILRKIAPQ